MLFGSVYEKNDNTFNSRINIVNILWKADSKSPATIKKENSKQVLNNDKKTGNELPKNIKEKPNPEIIGKTSETFWIYKCANVL
ncbi:MAG: hypothetical protein LBN19_01685 [Endomicrobium sp.]|jgi:hypothetical protein|nr:hypothetical protein [Endomicrobium sp.]